MLFLGMTRKKGGGMEGEWQLLSFFFSIYLSTCLTEQGDARKVMFHTWYWALSALSLSSAVKAELPEPRKIGASQTVHLGRSKRFHFWNSSIEASNLVAWMQGPLRCRSRATIVSVIWRIRSSWLRLRILDVSYRILRSLQEHGCVYIIRRIRSFSIKLRILDIS